jgi:hypothetical protein
MRLLTFPIPTVVTRSGSGRPAGRLPGLGWILRGEECLVYRQESGGASGWCEAMADASPLGSQSDLGSEQSRNLLISGALTHFTGAGIFTKRHCAILFGVIRHESGRASCTRSCHTGPLGKPTAVSPSG